MAQLTVTTEVDAGHAAEALEAQKVRNRAILRLLDEWDAAETDDDPEAIERALRGVRESPLSLRETGAK